VNSSLIKGEIPFLILATVVLLFLAGDSLYSTRAGELSSGDGAILILLFIAFLYYLFRSSRAKEDLSTPSHKSLVYSWGVTLIMVVGGFAALLWGGEIIVKNAIVIAQNWGISEATIGLTVVAVGTSLPEMATSIVAAIKGRSDIAVGNVIGSNILNILMILGLSSLIAPLPFSNESIAETVLSLGATVVVLIAARVDKNRNIGPLVGTFLLLLYMATMLYIFSR
ncbi:MAG: sodium:calcium antiporter, partial [Bacteroidales bacterium]